MDETITKYLESVPQHRRERLSKIHELIIGLYPKARVDLSYKMPTYRQKSAWVAIANQKYYISVYTCGYHHIEAFKSKHPNIKTGKGCINFKDSDSIPTDDLTQVIRHAMQETKSGA